MVLSGIVVVLSVLVVYGCFFRCLTVCVSLFRPFSLVYTNILSALTLP